MTPWMLLSALMQGTMGSACYQQTQGMHALQADAKPCRSFMLTQQQPTVPLSSQWIPVCCHELCSPDELQHFYYISENCRSTCQVSWCMSMAQIYMPWSVVAV
jgi:hypothetical protein